MTRTARFARIQQALEQNPLVTARALMDMLEVSRATFRRDLDYMRDRLGVPIVWDAEACGYRLDTSAGEAGFEKVPGLWLNENEIYGLLTVIQLLTDLEPGSTFRHEIRPARERLEKLLEHHRFSASEIQRRIRVLQPGKRLAKGPYFQVVVHALLNRHRLFLRHFGRLDARTSEREVSPQRVVFYRDNWYLDAFCHLRNEMRSFSIDALESAQETDRPAVSVDDAVLKEELESTYGIFAGKKKQYAQLKFSPFRARWVEKEVWHPDQRIERLPDGSLILQVPYGDDRELVHDILKQGKDVEVVAPAELRNKVRDELRAMLDRHQ